MSKRVYSRDELRTGNRLVLCGSGATSGGPADDPLAARERLARAEAELARIQAECARLPRQARQQAEAERERLLAAARAEAGQAVAAARAEADGVREAARQEGYGAGVAAGRQDAVNRVAEVLARIEGLVDQGRREQERLVAEAEPTVIRLAVEIARKVVRDAVAVDTEAVARNLRAALARVRDKGKVTVRISTRDYRALQTELGDLLLELKGAGHTVVADPDLESGGGRIETDYGTIDATVATQLATLQATLLAPAAAGDGSDAQPR